MKNKFSVMLSQLVPVSGVKYLKLYWEKKCGHPHPSGLGSFVGDRDEKTLSQMLCFTLKPLHKPSDTRLHREVPLLPVGTKWSRGTSSVQASHGSGDESLLCT